MIIFITGNKLIKFDPAKIIKIIIYKNAPRTALDGAARDASSYKVI